MFFMRKLLPGSKNLASVECLEEHNWSLLLHKFTKYSYKIKIMRIYVITVLQSGTITIY